MGQKKYTVLLDCGDTIVDEGTEVKDYRGATLKAELIPGADRMIRGLVEKGYTLGLVADGYVDTFRNSLTQHDLYHLFSAIAISEEVGVDKPDPKIFRAALDQLGIDEADYGRVVMVGNNLERDIKGANLLGIRSVFLTWSPRRTKTPADPSEVPTYWIETPEALLGLMDRLEEEEQVG